MKIFNNLVLTLISIAVVGVIVIGGIAWFWWQQNSAEFISNAKVVAAEGYKYGGNLNEGECVVRALEKHKADWNRSIMSGVRNGLWLTGCLSASKLEEKFCVDVPPESEFVSVGVWTGTVCAQHDFSDSYCPSLIRNISKYCSSTERLNKVKQHKLTRVR